MGKVSVANMVIFLVIASLMLIFTHTIIWIPICKARGSTPSQVSPGVNESDKLPLNQQGTNKESLDNTSVIPVQTIKNEEGIEWL